MSRYTVGSIEGDADDYRRIWDAVGRQVGAAVLWDGAWRPWTGNGYGPWAETRIFPTPEAVAAAWDQITGGDE